jgi:tetratricopeptide (TPR) repeat protein
VSHEKLRRDIGVDALLTGKIVRQGDDLTIQADLIDASDGSQIWGSRYTRKLAAAYELHGAVALDLSNKLGLKLTADQARRLTKSYTENTEAYHLYLLGRYFWNKRSEESLNKSIEYFQQAIEKDPNYAVAYAGLADSYAVMAISADLPAHEVFPKAKVAAAKALELDDTLVETHATMLRIKSQYDWDWAGVETEYRRALELNPNYPMTHVYYISYLMAAGRMDEAVLSIKRAQELDPLSLVINAVAARALFFAGRHDEAIAAARKTLELDDKVFLARLILGRSLARKGMYDDAITELEKARSLPGTVSEASSLLAHSYAVAGRKAEAQQVLDEMTQLSKRRYVQPYDFAMVHAGLGDKDRALEWLEKAHADKNHQITLINIVPEQGALRSDPRFERLVAQMRSGR